MHGWLIIDKPLGPGSTDIVSKVKRALRDGGYPKLKVGHGGTLDPLASGVLPVALGEATKLAGRMLDADKVYAFTIRFGEETDTLDAEGAVVATSEARPTVAEIDAVLDRFMGEIEQVPPVYSALKVEGKRAYALARAGAEVELKSRRVRIHSLSIRAEPVEAPSSPLAEERQERASTSSARTDLPATGLLSEIALVARVSKGTYIRSLARDIARALDSVGHVTMLRRLKAGPFTLATAISLDKMGELAKARQLEQALLPLTAGLDDIPALPVTPDQAGLLRQGRKLAGIAAKPGLHLATDESVPVALVELSEGELRVVRGFNI
ncbi:MAG: tRNA pseudouridine(55) synthase TruB [Allosphingosinicella sp.]